MNVIYLSHQNAQSKFQENALLVTQKTAQSNHQTPNLCCGLYGDLGFLVEINNRLPNTLSTPIDPVIQTLIKKRLTYQVDSNFVSLFRDMPSFLYCHLRAHQTKEMPAAIFW